MGKDGNQRSKKSLTHSFNQYVLTAYEMPGTGICTEETGISRNRCSPFMELKAQWGTHVNQRITHMNLKFQPAHGSERRGEGTIRAVNKES